MTGFFEKIFYHNSIKEWLIATAILCFALLVLRFIKKQTIKRLNFLSENAENDFYDLALRLVTDIKPFISLVLVGLVGAQSLTLPEKVSNFMRSIAVLTFLVQGGIWSSSCIGFWLNQFKENRLETDPASVTTVSALGFVAKIVLWIVLFLLALENLGINVTGLAAGLGIGGIAIALAVQNVLGDLFASLSIVLDKPFVIGDFIIVDNYLGTVKTIGLKTTRIQSLSGEQLIMSNSDLLGSRIRNYKRMYERRVVFTLGVTYQTLYSKLEAIPKMLSEIIEAQQETRLDRAHFREYGDFALIYEVVYFVTNPDYNVYMDTQQAINLAIHRRFEEQKIEFAYPTQTLYIPNKANINSPFMAEGTSA